ncbi:MAG TPA: carbohydrate ABC transporter permease, partial [Firmicutes bacterium]|nr:carbohydrate ABC transporter permease [Bacillota bacterium]
MKTAQREHRYGSKRRQEIIGRILAYIIVSAGAIVFLIPFLWMVSTSLKPPHEVYLFPPKWIPSQFIWRNYAVIFRLLPVGRFMWNSVILSVGSTVGTILSCALVAFAFARLRFRGSNLLFIILLVTMMLPGQVTMVPL